MGCEAACVLLLFLYGATRGHLPIVRLFAVGSGGENAIKGSAVRNFSLFESSAVLKVGLH